MAALAAGSFAANEAIAGLVGESNFSSIYQQGEHHSLLVGNVGGNLLLVVIFKATTSVGRSEILRRLDRPDGCLPIGKSPRSHAGRLP